MSADLCFTNGPILTLDAACPLLEDGYLAVTDGVISEIGVIPRGNAFPVSARETIDLSGKLLMPGLVNAHTHAFTALFRGLGCVPSPAEMEGKLGAKALQDWVYRGTKLACLEMIMSGTTGFCDVSPCADAVARAADEAGLRAVAGQLVTDRGTGTEGGEHGMADGDLDSLRKSMAAWASHGRVGVAVAPDLTADCSSALLHQCSELASEFDAPLIVEFTGATGTRREPPGPDGNTTIGDMLQLGLLSPRLVCVQATRLATEDVEAIAEHGAMMVYCPAHAMRDGGRDVPLPELLARNIPVGLGTDDCSLGDSLDLFRTLDTTAKWEAVINGNPAALNARQILGMGVRHGSGILGSKAAGGALAVGNPADLVLLDLRRAHLTPVYRYASHLVYCARGADVLSTMVDGRWLMRDRQIRTLSPHEIHRQVAPMIPAAKRLTTLSAGGRTTPST